MPTSNNAVVGIELTYARTVEDAISLAHDSCIEFIIMPLYHPRFRRNRFLRRDGPGTRSDMILPASDWIANIVGKISDRISLDNISASVRKESQDVVHEEVSWAAHLGLQAVLLPTPEAHSGTVNYTRFINQLCTETTRHNLWITIPLEAEPVTGIDGDSLTRDSWMQWKDLMLASDHSRRLGVALDVKSEPADSPGVWSRWLAEPVKVVILDTRVFLANKSGYPVLSKTVQNFLRLFMESKIHIVISGRIRHPVATSLLPYVQYIRYLDKKFSDERMQSFGESFTFGYRDFLQSPLQPLMDNLESQTYDVFEKDPVKYDLYTEAIEKALRKYKDGTNDVAIAVLGAGRGPIVACALKAAVLAGVTVKITAVEKNKHAIVTLRNRIVTENWKNVRLISSDMRDNWCGLDEKVDIMVSELLGSWGDNELSPECLDGAEKCLKKNGICIPANYTSYLAPISSSKLWNSARELPKGLDTPFVVKLHSHFVISDPLPLFRFDHPRIDPIMSTNERYAELCFVSSQNSMLHGFSGTFECELFENTLMSIMPKTHSPGMFSWFPLFLPLSRPVDLRIGDTVRVAIWRCVSEKRVWYEWRLLEPQQTLVQNPNGSSFWIGL